MQAVLETVTKRWAVFAEAWQRSKTANSNGSVWIYIRVDFIFKNSTSSLLTTGTLVSLGVVQSHRQFEKHLI